MIQTQDRKALALEALAEVLGLPLGNLGNAGQKQLVNPYGMAMPRFKHDTPTGTPTNIYAHGPGGLFTLPGVDPDVFSAMLGVIGMIDMLPTRPSIFTNPLYTTVTGVTAETGNEKDGVCDDPPVAGLMKACTQTAVFGRYELMTRELELDRLGQYINLSDPQYLRLMNSPTGPGGMSEMPFGGSSMEGTLNNEIMKVMFELNVSFMYKLTRQLWTGNPANNSAGGGYKEFPGFDLLIGTGKVDAETNTACPAMDSDVKDFAHKKVDGSDGGDIVQAMTYLMRYLKNNADKMRLSPVSWVIAMRQTLFWELTAVWPCSYVTYMCNFNGRTDDARLNVNANDQIAMRDDMRQGRYLLIDGIRFPVVLDDGITELDGNSSGGNFPAGCFESDIYVIPLTVMGGTPVTYLEHLNYNNPSLQMALNQMYRNYYQVSGDGAWILHAKPPINWCIQWLAKIEPRLIMRTPQLAGRLNNVVYCPLQHEREPYPDDPYHSNGGRTNRNAFPPSFYNEW